MTQPVFLIGPRGCGKTTIGRRLAQARNYRFVDTDHALLERERRTVAAIVQQEGWSRFRELESSALKEVTGPDTLIATGGGIVLAADNRLFMRENGVVVYLQTSVDALIARLEAAPQSDQRPALTGKAPGDEIAEILAEREALYCASAHHIIDATAAPDDVVERVIAALSNVCAN